MFVRENVGKKIIARVLFPVGTFPLELIGKTCQAYFSTDAKVAELVVYVL